MSKFQTPKMPDTRVTEDQAIKAFKTIGVALAESKQGYGVSDTKTVDQSDAADAKRMRWILAGNGYFMEEEQLCGHKPCSDREQAEARRKIDQAMIERPR